MEQMDLYRSTKESILAGRGAAAFRDMNLKARDRALQQEMKAERNLHPALCTPDGHYKARIACELGPGSQQRHNIQPPLAGPCLPHLT